MGKNVAQKLIETHLVDGHMQPGKEIGLNIDQTLTQDATGTMVMLEFEAMQIPRVKAELSAQYVDHNLLQTDFKNADDHLFLLSACKKFGVWYSRPGNGVSHPVHMERFGIPGRTLLGSDSHTPAAGALGMLAMGAGGREEVWTSILPDTDAAYDETDEIDLSSLEPLIALPSSPGNVVAVSEVAGREIYQAYIGSSANPGLRDFAVPALMLDEKQVHDRVSFDINPTSRQILENLAILGLLEKLIRSGARIHQAGCNGCIGMGQAPATGKISLRTVPRNFPGRSGTKDDQVYLCSPETAAASALTGVITDPRTLNIDYPRFSEPDVIRVNTQMLLAPADSGDGIELEKGPNIKTLPAFDPLPETILGPVLLKVGDDISTDEIMPAGAQILPYRSNIPEISKYAFIRLDNSFYDRAVRHQQQGFIIIAGSNYGQGSSREHAAIAPRYLGLKAVIAKSFARIHWQNLINFGMLPLTFVHAADYDHIEQEDELEITNVQQMLRQGTLIQVTNKTKNETYNMQHTLSQRQVEMIIEGSLINVVRKRQMQA
jgi:aconitate hydratase